MATNRKASRHTFCHNCTLPRAARKMAERGLPEFNANPTHRGWDVAPTANRRRATFAQTFSAASGFAPRPLLALTQPI